MKGRKIKVKSEKGITLIALIITIILLIILSVVTITNIAHSDLFGLATGAAEEYGKSEVEERFRLAEAGAAAKGAEEGKDVTLDDYIDELKKEGIINPDQITDNGDGSKEVVTPDGWVAKVIPDEEGNFKDVEIEGRADHLSVYITKILAEAEGTDGIKVSIETIRDENATYTYYYKEGTESEEGDYKEAKKGTKEKTCTITGLKQDTAYKVKVVAKDKEGESIKYANVRTGAIGDATGVISVSPITWENGVASITVTGNTNEKLQMKYTVYNGESPIAERENQPIEVGGKIGELYLGYIVRVYLTDGTNKSQDSVAVPIEDFGKPAQPTIQIAETATEDNWYNKVINVTITAGTDAESGANKIRYEVTGAEASIGNVTTTEGTLTATLTINTDGITTIKAYTIDKANNETETPIQKILQKDTSKPNAPTINVTDGTTENQATYTKDITVTITPGGETGTIQSGIKGTTYSITGTNGFTTDTGEIASGNKVVNLTQDAQYTITATTKDKAGNETKATKTVTKVNNPPVIGTVTVTNKTTNSITVEATATDVDSTNLTYILSAGTSQTNLSYKSTSVSGTQGQKVTLTVNGLSEYTDYYYNVQVSDGTNSPNKVSASTVRTFCPGNEFYCPGYSYVTCPTCKGNYKRYATGSESTTKKNLWGIYSYTSGCICGWCGTYYSESTAWYTMAFVTSDGYYAPCNPGRYTNGLTYGICQNCYDTQRNTIYNWFVSTWTPQSGVPLYCPTCYIDKADNYYGRLREAVTLLSRSNNGTQILRP